MTRVDLEDYELLDQIGTGTVGSIFRARQRSTGDVLAIKFLSSAVSRNRLVVARFAREMMILEKLTHPNILAYYGGGDDKGQLFFVMELIDGGTLKDLVSQTGNLSWEETAEVARQIAGALQHAHNHGIIHRDLKPGNVFITRDGVLKLGDFGIARDVNAQDLTEMGLTVGTYSYMPPELVRGDKAITGQVDLYALGCVIFELMVGRPPFVGDNFAQIFDQHLKASPPRPSDLGIKCPIEMEELISDLLKKEPSERPFNARSVQGRLGELLEDNNTSSADSSDRAAEDVSLAQTKLTNRVRSRKTSRSDVSWRTLMILALLIAAAIGLVLILGRSGL